MPRLTVPTIEQQTGKKRVGPAALYSYDDLKAVNRFDFDLNTPGFLDYHISRYGNSWNWNSSLWCDVVSGKLSDEQIISGPELSLSETGYQYTASEREGFLRVVYAVRRSLQDTWELWCNKDQNIMSDAQLELELSI